MRMSFFRIMAGLILSCAALSVSARYPTRPIRLIVPILPGGPLDAAARVVAQALSQSLGQQVVVDNRPGADGAIGAQAVLAAPADGYTLFFADNTAIVGAPLFN